MTDQMERILERVARELSHGSHASYVNDRAVLKRRLGPLLEAGEECAIAHQHAMWNEFNDDSEQAKKWIEALAEAERGKE